MEFKEKIYMDHESYIPNEDNNVFALSHLEAMQIFNSKSEWQNVGRNMINLEMFGFFFSGGFCSFLWSSH